MDVYKIDRTTFLPESTLIEGWSSMVWTERHKEFGDFQLKTPQVAETMARIPDGSLIGIRGSGEVMMVEDLLIEENDKGIEELTVTGRTLEAFLENRVLTGPYQTPWPMPKNLNMQNAIEAVIWNSIVNPNPYEAIRSYQWDHLSRDNIPNVVVTDSVVTQRPTDGKIDDLSTTKQWWMHTGPIYQQILDFMNLGGNLGIRIIRPITPNANVVTVAAYGLTSVGQVFTPNTGAPVNQLRFDIYNGRNRTSKSAVDAPSDPQPALTFRQDMGHLDKPKYLFSRRTLKNVIHVQSSIASHEVVPSSAPTGLDLYMSWEDYGSISNTISPTDFTVALTQYAIAQYNRQKRKQVVEASISAYAPYVYGRVDQGGDYYLGDLVELAGKYGTKATMQVNEFIRTADKTGERSYPTLVVPQ